MANKLQLTRQEINKIEFKEGILLPDIADKLFEKFRHCSNRNNFGLSATS